TIRSNSWQWMTMEPILTLSPTKEMRGWPPLQAVKPSLYRPTEFLRLNIRISMRTQYRVGFQSLMLLCISVPPSQCLTVLPRLLNYRVLVLHDLPQLGTP